MKESCIIISKLCVCAVLSIRSFVGYTMLVCVFLFRARRTCLGYKISIYQHTPQVLLKWFPQYVEFVKERNALGFKKNLLSFSCFTRIVVKLDFHVFPEFKGTLMLYRYSGVLVSTLNVTISYFYIFVFVFVVQIIDGFSYHPFL